MGKLETVLTPENRLLGVCDAYEGRSQETRIEVTYLVQVMGLYQMDVWVGANSVALGWTRWAGAAIDMCG